MSNQVGGLRVMDVFEFAEREGLVMMVETDKFTPDMVGRSMRLIVEGYEAFSVRIVGYRMPSPRRPHELGLEVAGDFTTEALGAIRCGAKAHLEDVHG